MAVSKRKKPPEPNSRVVTVDAWTLKCLYNKSDYGQRISSGEFVQLHREPGNLRFGKRSVQAYYGRPSDGLLMVRLQWHEDASGQIVASGLKEPKQLYLQGISYHRVR